MFEIITNRDNYLDLVLIPLKNKIFRNMLFCIFYRIFEKNHKTIEKKISRFLKSLNFSVFRKNKWQTCASPYITISIAPFTSLEHPCDNVVADVVNIFASNSYPLVFRNIRSGLSSQLFIVLTLHTAIHYSLLNNTFKLQMRSFYNNSRFLLN